jgi:hypothetical protein
VKKFILVSFLSLLLLTACKQEKVSIIEAFKSEGIKISSLESRQSMLLSGIKATSFYRIESGETLAVYEFSTKEKQELGYKDFKKQREVYNIMDPPVYRANRHLVISYGGGGVELKERIQSAVNRIR